MRIIIPLSFMLIAIFSCSKEKDKANNAPLNGRYSGTFKRYNQAEDITANVSLFFLNNGWTGNSNLDHYPALSKGTWSINEQEAVIFDNTSTWTADFDWTLILDGIYILHRNDDSLVFTKSYGNGGVDVYKLRKQSN
jgi:hypothetical protein